MRAGDILAMAFLNLWRRKLRAFLTVLGMVIGMASIIVMISLGIGINEAHRQTYESAGSLTTIEVSSYNWQVNDDGMYSSTEVKLDNKSVQTFRQMKGVSAVMPRIETWGYIKSGQYIAGVSILGIEAEEAEEFGFKLGSGRMPRATAGNRVEMVIGSWTMRDFYNPATGKQAYNWNTGTSRVSLEHSRFQLTFDSENVYSTYRSMDMGYEDDGSSGRVPGKMYTLDIVGEQTEEGNNNAYYALMDMEQLMKLAKQNKDYMHINTDRYDSVLVKCARVEDVRGVKEEIARMGYGTYSLQDQLDAAQKSTEQLRYLLGAIGGVALLVAAIGIMNTMLMSIYERTKEIGVIKVLGCRMRNIAMLFLTEAAYIGLIGGLIGLGVSYGLSAVLNNFLLGESGMMSVIPVYLGIFALAFSIVVALLSGMYPAARAMRLSALSAIRSE